MFSSIMRRHFVPCRFALPFELLIGTIVLVTIPVASQGYPVLLPTDIPVGTQPFTTFVADYDGDGDQDMAVTNLVSNSVSILLNSGQGAFASPVNYATGIGPFSLFASNLNDDDMPDLVVSNSGAHTISVLMNNGNGTFAGAVHYSTGLSPHGVVISKLDGDEFEDVAVVNRDDDNVSIFLNPLGDGILVLDGSYSTAMEDPIGLSSCDLNGDGLIDLVATCYAGDVVSVFLNPGGGVFAERDDYATAGHPRAVACGDLNGDGLPDVAAACTNVARVTVLRNLGGGELGNRNDYVTGGNPNAVLIAPVDGDSQSDLVVANGTDNSISFLANVNNLTFASKRDYPVGVQPWGVACGHLDTNGLMDLAAANRFSNSVTVLLQAGDSGSVEPAGASVVAFRLEQVSPNPSMHGATIQYTLAAAASTSLRVMDVTGRHVVTLVDAWQEAGTHQVEWHGADRAGRKMSSGVYWYRLSAGGQSQTRKLVLVD